MSITIKNASSKEERTVSSEEWETIKSNKLIKGWFAIEPAKKPKELESFEAAKAAKKESPVTDEGSTAAPEKPKSTGK